MHSDYISKSRLHLLPPDIVPDVFLTPGHHDIPSAWVPYHPHHIEAIKLILLPSDQLLHPPVAHWSPPSMSLRWSHGVDNANEPVLAWCELSVLSGPCAIIDHSIIEHVDIKLLLRWGERYGQRPDHGLQDQSSGDDDHGDNDMCQYPGTHVTQSCAWSSCNHHWISSVKNLGDNLHPTPHFDWLSGMT